MNLYWRFMISQRSDKSFRVAAERSRLGTVLFVGRRAFTSRKHKRSIANS